MARVGFFSEHTIFGGGESNLVRLAAALAPHHEVAVAAPEGALLEAARERGLATHSLGRYRNRWLKGLPVKLRGYRELVGRFDVVHAYSLHALPTLLGHPRLFWTVHGPWEKPWGWRGSVVARHARAVIAVSSDVARSCRLARVPLHVIPLGALEASSVSTPPPGVRTLEDCQPLRIGVLGRLQAIKGQDLALEAAAALADRLPSRRFELHLAGAANPRSQEDLHFARALEGRISSLRGANLHVLTHGFVARPLAWLAGMDLVLVPSRYESFSMVTVEALALGKPVVVPDVGGPAELVPDESLGLRFAPGDARAMSAALERAATGAWAFEPSRLARRALAFTLERQRDAHLALYDEALRGSAASASAARQEAAGA